MTILEEIARLAAEEKEAKEKLQRERDAERAIEEKRLKEAADHIRKELSGLVYLESNYCFDVSLSRTVYVTYGFTNDTAKYSDDTPEVDIRRLRVSIGYYRNAAEIHTSVEQFTESFILFMRREQLWVPKS